MPNGLCFSPDESLLYINDTPRRATSGSSTSPRTARSQRPLLREGIGDGDLEKGGLVDGMKCDERGNIWVTGPGGVWVFSAEGEHLGVVGSRRARQPHLGRPRLAHAVRAGSTSVYRIDTRSGPRREPYMR